MDTNIYNSYRETLIICKHEVSAFSYVIMCFNSWMQLYTVYTFVQHLGKPKKRVLMTTDALQRSTNTGHRQIHQACQRAHYLMSRTQSTKAQEWLLQADHERFVNYKWNVCHHQIHQACHHHTDFPRPCTYRIQKHNKKEEKKRKKTQCC